MNAVVPVHSYCNRLHLQTIALPVQSLQVIFWRVIGTLLVCLGVKKWGSVLLFQALKMENQGESVLNGLVLFGKRFLVSSDNHGRVETENLKEYQQKGYCRGSCYWLIDQFFKNPGIPLTKLAQEFEEGAPEVAAAIHESGGIPVGIDEVRVWSHRVDDWLQVPRIEERGVYTILVGFSENEERPTKAHRMTIFRFDKTYFFDPIYGLIEWKETDWIPHLQRVGKIIKTAEGPESFFTVECYRHALR